MGIIRKRWLNAALFTVVMLIVTACIQQVGDDALGQAVSIVITQTDTPAPASDTPTSIPAQAEAVDVPISENSTESPTPTLTATATETATNSPLVVAQSGGEGQQLQPTETDDPFELRATTLIEEATQTAVAPTTQAAASQIGFTATPIPSLTATLSTGQDQPTFTGTGTDCVHEVRAGETLFRLSLYYGIPVNDIVSRNGIVNPNVISIGQRLIINNCGTTGALPPPTSTPSPTATQIQLGGNLGIGGPNLGGTGETGAIGSVGCQAQYTVQQYDTLFQISLQYGVTVQAIANANGIVNVGRIDMGDVLCIPAT